MRAARAGSLAALVLDVLMLSAGHISLWRQMGLLGSFYDIQGRALLHGHLAVPNGSASFEGFVINGRTYVYFGLVPAILRLPVLLITHALDGRMTQLSMLLALIVLLEAGARAHWRVRKLLRSTEEEVSRRERAVAFTLALALGAGGVPLFLSSWAVIYHEAELWGAAFALAAVAAILAALERPSGRRIAFAGLLTLLAANTRISVGLGPIIALALTAAFPLSTRLPARARAYMAVAALVALGSAVAINELKFGTAFGIPLAKQIDTQIDPVQRAFVVANHGSATGLKFLPTTLLAAVRPDALGTVRAFPFIGLPSSPPTVIGSVRFNALLPSLSAFTSMPLLCLLVLAGIWRLVRDPRARPLLWILLGTAAAFGPALVFGSIATRYLADLLPFLFIAGCGAMQVLYRDRRWSRSSWILGAIAVATLAGVLIDGAVGLVQQRLLAPNTSTADRAAFIRAQDGIDRFLGRRPHGVHAGAALPSGALGPLGDLFVLGRCDGLYVESFKSFSGTWLPVERTSRSGLHQLSVRFNGSVTPPQALLGIGTGPRQVTVAVRGGDAGRVTFTILVGHRAIATGSRVILPVGRPVRVMLSIDPAGEAWFASVTVGSAAAVVTAPVPYNRLAALTLGAALGFAPFSGTVTALPQPTPVCDQVARRAGLPLATGRRGA